MPRGGKGKGEHIVAGGAPVCGPHCPCGQWRMIRCSPVPCILGSYIYLVHCRDHSCLHSYFPSVDVSLLSFIAAVVIQHNGFQDQGRSPEGEHRGGSGCCTEASQGTMEQVEEYAEAVLLLYNPLRVLGHHRLRWVSKMAFPSTRQSDCLSTTDL